MTGRQPALFIIDCDPGVDDILALLLAALSKEVKVLAYTVNFGNTTVDNGARNIIKMFYALAKEIKINTGLAERAAHILDRGTKAPLLSLGARQPLLGQVFHASYYHGADGLASINVRRPDLDPLGLDGIEDHGEKDAPSRFFAHTDKSAPEVLLDTLATNSPGEVSLVALGPLTNLAIAFQKDEKTFRRVRQIFVMGGALDVPGNVGPHSEFNFYADPAAARIILSAEPPLPMILLPLDITSKHLMAKELYTKHIKDRAKESPLCDFLTAFLDRTFEIAEVYNGSGIEVHDPLAMATAIRFALTERQAKDTHDFRTIWRSFDIETKGELTRGMCVVDRRMDASLQKGQTRSESRLTDHEKTRQKPSEGTNFGVSETLLAGGPAVKEIIEPENKVSPPGSQVVVRTTGQDSFIQSWFQRVLGIDLGFESMIPS